MGGACSNPPTLVSGDGTLLYLLCVEEQLLKKTHVKKNQFLSKWRTKMKCTRVSFLILRAQLCHSWVSPPHPLLWSTHHYMIVFFFHFFSCFHEWQWEMAGVISVNRCGPGFCSEYKGWFSEVICKRFHLKELDQLKPKCVLGVHVSLCFHSPFGFSWRSGSVLERVQMLLKQTTDNKIINWENGVCSFSEHCPVAVSYISLSVTFTTNHEAPNSPFDSFIFKHCPDTWGNV